MSSRGGMKPVRLVGKNKYGRQVWLFECICGNEKITNLADFKSGRVKSCGCANKGSKPRHGMSGTRIYNIWVLMLQRCNNPSNPSYKDYGGKGIIVCDRWHTFENFYEDMGEPLQGRTLDRISNSGNYDPMNCVWASSYEQANNKSNNRVITYLGETKNLVSWSRQLGINYYSLMYRLDNGWSVERAFTTPIGA